MPLNIEEFANLLEARVVLKDSQTEYNTYRPHQSLRGLTPAEYATHSEAQHQPTLPQQLDPQTGPRQRPWVSVAGATGLLTAGFLWAAHAHILLHRLTQPLQNPATNTKQHPLRGLLVRLCGYVANLEQCRGRGPVEGVSASLVRPCCRVPARRWKRRRGCVGGGFCGLPWCALLYHRGGWRGCYAGVSVLSGF